MPGLRWFAVLTAAFLASLTAVAESVRAQPLTPGHEATERLFYLVLVPALGIGILVMALVAYAVLKFRVRKGHTAGPMVAKTHDPKLETLWTVIPALILLVVGAVGFQALLVTDTIPDNPDVIVVVRAQQWAWSFNVTDARTNVSTGFQAEEFTVRVGQTVKLVFESIDVAHAFYIPAFQLKIDVIPGHENVYWFRALQPGVFEIHCAEFCGLSHYSMIGNLHVVP